MTNAQSKHSPAEAQKALEDWWQRNWHRICNGLVLSTPTLTKLHSVGVLTHYQMNQLLKIDEGIDRNNALLNILKTMLMDAEKLELIANNLNFPGASEFIQLLDERYSLDDTRRLDNNVEPEPNLRRRRRKRSESKDDLLPSSVDDPEVEQPAPKQADETQCRSILAKIIANVWSFLFGLLKFACLTIAAVALVIAWLLCRITCCANLHKKVGDLVASCFGELKILLQRLCKFIFGVLNSALDLVNKFMNCSYEAMESYAESLLCHGRNLLIPL